MNKKILFVDDDENLLEGYRRNLRNEFEFEGALNARDGLEIVINQGPFAVVISDMRMPGADGLKFLSILKEKFPDTVRIMLTGNADMQTAINAVNEGSVFQFLTKPCSPDRLKNSINLGLRQHQLITSEKELMEKTLKGIIRILSDILAATNPAAFSRSSRIVRLAVKLAQNSGYKELWKIEIASMLSQIGYIAIPEVTLNKIYAGEKLEEKEQEMILQNPKIAFDLLSNIPRLEELAKIIYYQDKRFNGAGFPVDDAAGKNIPLESRILKIVLDYDTLISANISKSDALNKIKGRTGWYDTDIVILLENMINLDNEQNKTSNILSVNLTDLKVKMILAEDVVSRDGKSLLPKGQEVTDCIILRLENYSKNIGIKEPIKVTRGVL